jgi:predicted nucleic acid-binding protein
VREGTERLALEQLLSTLEIADVSSAIAAQGGLLRRDWGKSHGVGLNDALIAATAQHLGLRVFSLNLKRYPMLEASRLKQAYVKDSVEKIKDQYHDAVNLTPAICPSSRA